MKQANSIMSATDEVTVKQRIHETKVATYEVIRMAAERL